MKKYKIMILMLIVAIFGVVIAFIVNAGTEKEEYQFKNKYKYYREGQSYEDFFGHQSVGGNILDGIKDLDKESEISIIPTREAIQITESAIYHASIGQNGSPQNKIDDFSALLNSGIGDKIDLAFMKFCYLDFNKNTDIQSVFASYSATISQLQTKYPNIQFIHTTVPLISNNMTAKDWIKRILGRSQKMMLII